MTEEEKMRQGLLYDANYDEELLAERRRCKELCFEYNRLSPAREDERRALIRRLLGRTGRRFEINAPFWCDYGRNVEIGENFYANHNCIILDGAKVVFGDNVFVGPNCGFYTAGHPLDAGLRGRGLEYAKPITVGDNVWIGRRQRFAGRDDRQRQRGRRRQRGQPRHSRGRGGRRQSLPGDSPDCGNGPAAGRGSR